MIGHPRDVVHQRFRVAEDLGIQALVDEAGLPALVLPAAEEGVVDVSAAVGVAAH